MYRSSLKQINFLAIYLRAPKITNKYQFRTRFTHTSLWLPGTIMDKAIQKVEHLDFSQNKHTCTENQNNVGRRSQHVTHADSVKK